VSDEVEAQFYLQQAADSGHAEAQYLLAQALFAENNSADRKRRPAAGAAVFAGIRSAGQCGSNLCGELHEQGKMLTVTGLNASLGILSAGGESAES
jgi:hypothetical protein